MAIKNTLSQLMDEKGISNHALGRAVGVSEGTIRHARDLGVERLKALSLYRVAQQLGTSMETLLNADPLGETDGRPANALPICFRTGGGAWIETDDYRQDHLGYHTGTNLPKYKRFKQWYELLEGDSMNKLLPSGAYLHVVDTRDMGGYLPKESDIVIVERTRDAGFLRERSAKQVHYENGTLELWPRSTSPRWQKPIIINEHPDDETVSVEIVGLVARAVIDFAT